MICFMVGSSTYRNAILSRETFLSQCFESKLLGASKQQFYIGEVCSFHPDTRLGTRMAQQAVLQQQHPLPGCAKVATLDCNHQALVMLALVLTCLQVSKSEESC